MPRCSFCECEIPLPTLGNNLEIDCPHCGRPVELKPEDLQSTSANPGTITLLGVSNCKSLELPINQSLVLGRENYGSDILQDRKFSRKHCLIETNPQAPSICDLGSLNGTFVNGMRIAVKTTLKNEDIILIADEAFILKLNTPVATEIQPEASNLLHVCANCGYQDSKGLSRCPECGFGFS